MGTKVLVVDDSRFARLMTRRVIEAARPGWEVVEAVDGLEAIAAYERVSPDYVILDMNMPGIDGLETARQIRAHDPDAVLTLLTANIQDPVRLQAEALGVTFLTKPVSEAALLAFLRD